MEARELFTLYQDEESQASKIYFSHVAVAIPAYNEERFIGSVVVQALRYTKNVIVVDDGSNDATAYIAEKAGAHVIRHEQNRGKSEAVNTAFRWARQNHSQVLVLIDGDGQHRPDEIVRLIEPLTTEEADLVVGSRFMGVKSKIPLYRQVGQHGLNFATNLASGVSVTDTQSGFRAFSRKAIELLHFNGTGLSVECEMQFLAKQHKLLIREVPISVIYQEKAKRNPFSHGINLLTNIAKLVGQSRPLLFFGLSGLIFLLFGLMVGLITWNIYDRSRELAVGYALVTLLLTVLGVLALFVGLILHTISDFFSDMRKLIQSYIGKAASTE